jgi:hypothetical protein
VCTFPPPGNPLVVCSLEIFKKSRTPCQSVSQSKKYAHTPTHKPHREGRGETVQCVLQRWESTFFAHKQIKQKTNLHLTPPLTHTHKHTSHPRKGTLVLNENRKDGRTTWMLRSSLTHSCISHATIQRGRLLKGVREDNWREEEGRWHACRRWGIEEE